MQPYGKWSQYRTTAVQSSYCTLSLHNEGGKKKSKIEIVWHHKNLFLHGYTKGEVLTSNGKKNLSRDKSQCILACVYLIYGNLTNYSSFFVRDYIIHQSIES